MQQYAPMLGIIAIAWFLILAIRVMAYMDKSVKESKLAIPEKACPPHKWNWLDQPGMENTYYMMCMRCKKTPRQIGEET